MYILHHIWRNKQETTK